MISLVFRIALIVCSILTTVFMIKKIRNSKLQIEHAIFWAHVCISSDCNKFVSTTYDLGC